MSDKITKDLCYRPGKVLNLSDIFKIPFRRFPQFRNRVLVLISSGLIFIMCSNPAQNDGPEIYQVNTPDSLQKGSLEIWYAFAKVRDPQGLGDIDLVYCVVRRPDGSSNGIHTNLSDDGQNGDSIAGDGIYTRGFVAPADTNQTGDYVFSFVASDNNDNTSAAFNRIVRAYDSPLLSAASGYQTDSARQEIFAAVNGHDAQGDSTIDSIWAELTFQDSGLFIGSYILNDQGLDGDTLAADGCYSTLIHSPANEFTIGSYLLRFRAIDLDGHQATPVYRVVFIE